MAATTMGGTEHCWLSMIHSSVTPNCWLATQLDMDRLVVETAWDSLDTVISKHEGGEGRGGVRIPALFLVIFSHWIGYWEGVDVHVLLQFREMIHVLDLPTKLCTEIKEIKQLCLLIRNSFSFLSPDLIIGLKKL